MLWHSWRTSSICSYLPFVSSLPFVSLTVLMIGESGRSTDMQTSDELCLIMNYFICDFADIRHIVIYISI